MHALATGALVVTPNRRLARVLSARHDAAMLRSGKTAWPAGRVLPWPAWLLHLWQEAHDAGRTTQRLVAPIEARHLWRQIVGDDPALPPGTIDARGFADLAQEAWALVHAWGAGGPSWRAWRDTWLAPVASDPHAFIAWAERYRRELDSRQAFDAATLADVLAEDAGHHEGYRDSAVLLAGFLEFTPQQDRLCAALRGAGMDVAVAAEPAMRGTARRVVAPSPRDEIVLALQWARERALQTPEATIVIAIDGLAARRDEVRSLAEDVLCPELQRPGNAAARRPYDISLGAPLADAPIVAAALAWIGLAHGALDRAVAAALFRSPYGPGRWVARAGLERDWLERGEETITARHAVASLATVDAAAAGRLADAVAAFDGSRPRSARAWVAQWRDFLDRCGWPGEASLAGAAFEARDAFGRLLDAFVRLDALTARLSPGEALALLVDQAGSTVFQPQGQGGPVLLMGLIEAASVPCDALWVAGLSGQHWPPAPQPNPLLPLPWQREHEVPRASAARERAFASRITARLMANAPEVVLSAPATLAHAPARPTALVSGAWPPPVALQGDDSARRIATARAVETRLDAQAPALPPGAVRGGSGVIEAQADCPFMALARYRLRADPWPTPVIGLAPHERGQLVHALMAAFWRAVRSHDGLVALDPDALHARLQAATRTALSTLDAVRWASLPPAVASSERERLPAVAAAWIEEVERPRPGFTVERTEVKAGVELHGLVFRLTLDRVDALAGGGLAIVDYKTGKVESAKSWFAPRPRFPQLGLYWLALEAQTPYAPVRAVAYGSVKAGDVGLVGFAEDVTQWPALTDATRLADPPGWAGIAQYYAQHLSTLAAEIRDGVASVTPREAPHRPCERCARQSLCRIDAAREGGWSDDEVADD